jgi:hypothetical protein
LCFPITKTTTIRERVVHRFAGVRFLRVQTGLWPAVALGFESMIVHQIQFLKCRPAFFDNLFFRAKWPITRYWIDDACSKIKRLANTS